MKTKPYTIIWANTASAELTYLVGYYQHKDPELGSQFFFAVDQAMQMLTRYPKISPLWHARYRRLFLQRFPYFIVYRLRQDQLQVLAIFPARDDAKKLPQLLSNRL